MADLHLLSPRDVDPLSWFTSSLVPLVFGGLATVYGLISTLLGPRNIGNVGIELLAVFTMTLGFVAVGVHTRSRRIASVGVLYTIPFLFGWTGLTISALNRLYSADQIELWWAPVGLGFLVATLAPYLAPVNLLIIGGLSSIVTVAATSVTLAIGPRPDYWTPVTQALLGTGSVVVATVASTVFSYQLVKRTVAWASSRPPLVLTSGVLGEAAKRRILRRELESVSDRAVPLLRRVALAGVVTEADRQEARSLSETLRAELVERSNRSWLDSLARRMSITVIDQDHRADTMTPVQRTALLGLLRAATEGAQPGYTPVLIELRGEVDGSTAVALSTDETFPEGRRLTLLAPHYVTLRAAVDGLVWDSGDKFGVRFRLPAGGASTSGPGASPGLASDRRTNGRARRRRPGRD